MKPFKIGQVAKFHTPFPDEDPNQLYVVLELIEDQERSRARIQPLNTGLSLPPQTTVLLSDLEAELVKTNDLIGHQVYIDIEDKSQVRGKVLSAMEEEVYPFDEPHIVCRLGYG